VRILTPARISLRFSRAFDEIFILDYQPVFNYFGIGEDIGQLDIGFRKDDEKKGSRESLIKGPMN